MNQATYPLRSMIIRGLIVIALLFLAGYMRYTAVMQSTVFAPYRADAAQYYNYAYNLKKYGTYSRDGNSISGHIDDPKPDAMRPPGYSLFLVPLTGAGPNKTVIRTIQIWQIGLGVITVLLVFLLFRRLLTFWQAASVALITSISPHLVNTTIYMLSENLFAPLILLTLLLFSLHSEKKRGFLPVFLFTGIVMGLSALTRPVLEYFLPLLALLLIVNYPRKKAWKAIACMALGFTLAWGPWVVRNYASLGVAGDNHLMLATLHQGIYPGMMYQDNPDSLGYPYRYDPRYTQTNKDLASVLREIQWNFQENPRAELRWYLLGKPIMLWSWDMIAGAGDVFIYPTSASPYMNTAFPLFMFTHALMRGLHWPLVITALLGCILVWFRLSICYYNTKQILVFRAISLLLLYNTGILMLGAPFTRYSIPFLPLIYGMAISTAIPVAAHIQQIRKRAHMISEEQKSAGSPL